jgi:hypothetical protein
LAKSLLYKASINGLYLTTNMADIYNDLHNQALPLFDKLEPLDIKALIAKETNGRIRIRLLAFLHIKEGANRAVRQLMVGLKLL